MKTPEVPQDIEQESNNDTDPFAEYKEVETDVYSRLLDALDMFTESDIRKRLTQHPENDNRLILAATLAQSMAMVDAINKLTKAVKGLQPPHKEGCKCQT